MSAKASTISQDVLTVLSGAVMDGQALSVTQQLDRALYLRVNKVLAALGGKWNRKTKAHLFTDDARELVDSVILTGKVFLPDNFDFFPTPAEVVEKLFAVADLRPDHIALEPSAGGGAIAIPLSKIVKRVDCIEFVPPAAAELRERFDSVIEASLLDVEPTPNYDRIIMNPPFSKRQDIHHVLHAAGFLKPGGRLVSVMAAGVVFREDKLSKGFRQFVSDHGGSITALPENSFKVSGTSVNTVIVEFEGAPRLT